MKAIELEALAMRVTELFDLVDTKLSETDLQKVTETLTGMLSLLDKEIQKQIKRGN